MEINHQEFIYPPGYRFLPTDEELVVEYLLKKINNQPIPVDDIRVVNFYDHSPDTLSGAYPPLGHNEWYFFTSRNRKYRNGSRPDRTAGNGFWKATAADKPIYNFNGVTVGSKRSLKFCQGEPSNAIKTDWIMYEYTAANNQPSRNKRDANDMKLDDWVLCRIHKKAVKLDKSRSVALDHLHLPPAPENQYVPSDDLPLLATAPQPSDLEASDEDYWRNVFEELPVEEEVAPEPEGVLPSEFAADEDFWTNVFEGLPAQQEEQQQQEQQQDHGNNNIDPYSAEDCNNHDYYNWMLRPPPEKRTKIHYYHF